MLVPVHEIQLPVFTGPLDLLLRLIEREELDITEVSLVQVTDQYLSIIEDMGRREMADLTSFLSVAARLVLIKSRALLPRPPAAAAVGEEEDDVAGDLIRQLEEYRRFKLAAQELARREENNLRSYLRISPGPPVSPTPNLSGLSLKHLLTMAQEALEAVPARPVKEVITQIAITVADQILRIKHHLTRGKNTRFKDVLSEGASLTEVVITLLALLELLKRDEVRVSQERLFGPIFIEQPTESVSTAPEATPT
jgi:segregation and condensation protein A